MTFSEIFSQVKGTKKYHYWQDAQEVHPVNALTSKLTGL